MVGQEPHHSQAAAPPPGPVVLTRVATLQEADVIRAVLAGEGIEAFISAENAANIIPYMTLALCPRGIEVLVPGDRAQAAADILAEMQACAGKQPGRVPRAVQERIDEQGPKADDLAERARGSVLVSLLLWPACVVTLWYVVRAYRAGWTAPVRDENRFVRSLLVAMLFGVFVPLVCLIGLLAAYGFPALTESLPAVP